MQNNGYKIVKGPQDRPSILRPDDLILITGAAGFVGSKIVETLLTSGYRNLRAFVRPSSNLAKLQAACSQFADGTVDVFRGNLLSREDCRAASRGASLIFHVAAGTGLKSFPDAFLNSVVTTRNLLDACVHDGYLRRFVNVSSFAVYSNRRKPRWRLLDEGCPIEDQPALRGEAYCFAKIKQDEIVAEYSKNFGLPYVIVRPGQIYGPGQEWINGRVGIDTFGPFMHLGGSNKIPFTHVSNCAEAIVLAGLTQGVDGEVFNIVDDDLPSSRQFLRLCKRNSGAFRSIYIPHVLSYLLCFLWEQYSAWSKDQLPPAFNRKRWHAEWKSTYYTNEKAKNRLGWAPRVQTAQALSLFAKGCGRGGQRA